MRTETIIKVYKTFSELSEKQQSKVIENFREDIHHDFDFMIDDIYENFKELLDLIGFEDVEINYSGFSSQGDGASFTGKLNLNSNYKKDIKEKHLVYIDDIKTVYKLIENIKSEEIEDVYRSGRYYHECSIYCDNKEVQELARFISVMIYKELESQYNYLFTLEYIEEQINCNEYEFCADTLENV